MKSAGRLHLLQCQQAVFIAVCVHV